MSSMSWHAESGISASAALARCLFYNEILQEYIAFSNKMCCFYTQTFWVLYTDKYYFTSNQM